MTDCNTLYVGGRKNALDHLDSAYLNGFSPFSTGCQIIIADGLKGTDEAYVPVEGGEYIKEAKIGQAIMDADVFISLTHFKGHEASGFGGALKNIGMGCGSRAGKMEQHNAGKPQENMAGAVHRPYYTRCFSFCQVPYTLALSFLSATRSSTKPRKKNMAIRPTAMLMVPPANFTAAMTAEPIKLAPLEKMS